MFEYNNNTYDSMNTVYLFPKTCSDTQVIRARETGIKLRNILAKYHSHSS